MKFKIRKRVVLDLEMDSYECIMFCKGGQHNISLPKQVLEGLLDECKAEIDQDEDGDDDYYSTLTEYFIAIQLQDKGRFDWIQSEALKAKENSKDET